MKDLRYRDQIVRLIIAVGIVVAQFVGFIVYPHPAYAATEIRETDAEGSDTGSGYVGGLTNYTNMHLPDDDDTTYATFSGMAEGNRSWDMQNFTTVHSAINGVTVTMRVRNTGGSGSYARSYVKIGGTRYYAPTHYPDVVYNTYTDDTFGGVTNKNPATGLAWDQTSLNAAEFGASIKGGATWLGGPWAYYAAYCTTYYITVDYTVPTLPTVTTSSPTGAEYTGASHKTTLNGTITGLGGDASAHTRGYVWDTVSRASPGNVAANATAYANSWEEYGSFSTGSFSHQITGLIVGTKYYYRVFAKNVTGWTYGDESYFTTLNTTTITNVAASSIASTSARINAIVTRDGRGLIVDTATGDKADVRFGYDTVTHSANFSAYATITPWVNNTYATGDLPYVDLTGLTANTTYYYNVNIGNDVSTTATGSELTFTTTTGISAPTNFIAIPGTNSISLYWAKGSGATNTMVRYRTDTYPLTTASGTQAYFSNQASCSVTGLSPGTTYYFSAWSESGGAYSGTYVTCVATTGTVTGNTTTWQQAATPPQWWQAPDYTRMANFPLYDLINWGADTMDFPKNSAWTFLAFIACSLAGVALYSRNHQIPSSMSVVAIGMVFCSFMGIMSMWFTIPFCFIAIGSWVLGNRIGG